MMPPDFRVRILELCARSPGWLRDSETLEVAGTISLWNEEFRCERDLIRPSTWFRRWHSGLVAECVVLLDGKLDDLRLNMPEMALEIGSAAWELALEKELGRLEQGLLQVGEVKYAVEWGS